MLRRFLAMVMFGLATAANALSADPEFTVSEPRVDAQGVRTHEVRSPYQAGMTTIRVLLPTRIEPDRKYPVVFLLPVEAQGDARYGDGLLEAHKHDLANRHGVILVAPSFSHLPWYADHPTDPAIRQETYFLKVVVPTIERYYPASGRSEDRHLAGFSKSGWGAFSLLLRHPKQFGRAAAWDAPLMMDQPRYGMEEIVGDRENFANYHVPKLLKNRGSQLGKSPQLIIVGYGNFREDHRRFHALADEIQIAHAFRDGPARKHDWHSGWLSEAMALLLADQPARE